MSSALVLIFYWPLFAPKHSLIQPLLNFNLPLLHFLYSPSLPFTSYHALWLASQESIGHDHTNKINCKLFDSGLSKSLIHTCIVPSNYQPIHSNNDFHIFFLPRTTTSTNLVALQKIQFMEFNCNVVVNGHPSLFVDSMSLLYDIIFRVDFSDKCSFHLDNDNNLVQLIGHDIPLHD